MLTLDTNVKAGSATTQYLNFDFNSMVNFNGKALAANAEGIFELTGDTDNGKAIDAYFEPVTSDIGTIYPKRMRYAYVEMKIQGSLDLVIAVDGGSTQTYRITGTDMKPKRYRVPISRVLNGTYWLYQFKNVNGVDFSIDSANGVFIFRNHGLG